MTRTPAMANAPIRSFGSPAAFRAAALLGAVALATLPVTAQSQSPSLNIDAMRLVQPVTVVQPNLPLANPIVTLNPATLRPLAPNAVRIAPVTNPAIRPTGIAPSVASAGLGQLVAPGRQEAGVVVGRIGSTAGTAVPSLTIDFDGDGLINFEIAPGIVDVPTDTASSGGDALGGLVGQHITMATGTADRVLDSVINVAGVTPATTFEIANGTVVLGGFQPQDGIGVVDIPIPDGPTTHDPKGNDGRNPGRQPRPQGNDHATHDPVGDDSRQSDEVFCLSHGCYGDPPGPKPGPNPDTGPGLEGILNFTGFRRPPAPEPAPGIGMDDLLNVSIMLPLRGRERQGDQFSNYGNEEIW